jgi:hypothetical protein
LRQLDLLLADLDDAPHQVDREIAGAKHRPLAMHLQLMPQRRAQARQQLVHPERLCQIIVGAEIERLNLAGLVAATRQHHDRYAVVAAANHAQELVALNVRQAEVEDDQRRALREQVERHLAVARLQNVVALRVQPHPQQFADRRLVVDHQNLDRGALMRRYPVASFPRGSAGGR